MLALLALGCRPVSTELTLHVPTSELEVFRDFVSYAVHPDLTVDDGAARGRGLHATLTLDDSLGVNAYRIDADDRSLQISGGDRLGLQFGAAAALEAMGFRFLHPEHVVFPVEFDDLADVAGLGEVVVPDVANNGLHLHTLHPTDTLFDFWEPSDEGLERAKQVVDWLVKNRGTELEWVALDDILRFPGAVEPWQAHTGSIIDYAHSRGLKVGLGVQLFGSSNLQRAFDLVDLGPLEQAEIDRRLGLLAPTGPDRIALSFGEFSGEEPDVFVASAQLAVDRMVAVIPDVEATSTVHVGNFPDLRVEYQGEELLYYFLAKYIDGARPRIHTVMYYNLVDDAGLAYLHEEFDEHRAFLYDGLAAGENYGYYPESAYWVAFDINVPTYLPVYVRSRFVDLDAIRSEGLTLGDHQLFQSGWEWGYWQNDLLTLRMAHDTPDRWEDPVRWLWEPWGRDGEELADVIVALGELQHEALIVDRLAPYVAGREAIIDLGDAADIVSQPDRPQFDEILAMDVGERAAVEVVVAQLALLAVETDALRDRAEGLGGTDPFFDEVRDGLEIDALRARFASQVFGGAVALAVGGDAAAELVGAEQTLAAARLVVARRHAAAWWGGGDRIFSQLDENASIYRFGYLAKADNLCFWDRERVQLENLITGGETSVPPCT